MSTINTLCVRDNSTLTNFKQWAQFISNAFSSFGWTKSSDSGQVNWSTIATVPTANNYVYEIWQPGDALTTFYLKVEYGTNSQPAPSLRLSIGSSTNGAGGLTGLFLTASNFVIPLNTQTVTSTTTQWNCYASGDVSRVCFMMWRDESNANAPMLFVVQRSLSSSGSPTSAYVTLITGSANVSFIQQSVVFGVAVANIVGQSASGPVALKNLGASSDLFNGQVPMSPVFPDVGSFGNPLDALAVGSISDFTEGSLVTVAAANTPYGVSHTYLASSRQPFANAAGTSSRSCILLRYD